MTTRQEHLDWCKARALEYVAAGDLHGAFTSMCSDVGKHPGTAMHETTNQLGLELFVAGQLDSPQQMRNWINGYN